MRIPIGVVKEGERNPEHWFLLIGSPALPVDEFSVKTFDADSSGNIYFGAWYINTSKTSLRKYNSSGAILLSKIFDRGGAEQEWFIQHGLNVSSSGNIYTVNVRSSSSNYISRRNSSGVEQWRLTYVGVSFPVQKLDSSENIYTVMSGFQSPNAMVLSKLNSSGSVLFQRMLRNNSVIVDGSESADGIYAGVPPIIDNSGNIIVAAARQRNVSGSGWSEGSLVVKYNSSGALQWQKLMVLPTGSRIQSEGVASDSSGNIYVLILDPGIGGDPPKAIVVKLSPEGDILWQKNLFGFNTYDYGAISIDSSSNLYITASSGSSIAFVKYNSSGALQLQRLASISSASFSTVYSRLPKDSLILIQSSVFPRIGDKKNIILSLPTDGSVLGSYKMDGQTFTISAGAFSESNGSLTISNAPFLEGSPPSVFGGDPGGRGTSDVIFSDTIVKV